MIAKESKFLRQDVSKQTIQFSTSKDINEYLAKRLGTEFTKYREILEAAARFEAEPEFPVHLDLETTYVCNLRCIMCTHGTPEKRPRRPALMDFELFRSVIDEGEKYGLRAIGLDQEGDPLLHPRLKEFIDYACSKGVSDIMINTNALVLDEHKTDMLLHSGLSRIHFSLDAYTKETYDKIRIGSDFDKVKNNILSFCERKRELEMELPVTRVSFVKMSINEHELEDFVSFWSQHVDFIAIQEFNNPYPNDKNLEKLMPKSREKQDDYHCTQPWFRMVVLTDGSVLPCCLIGYSRFMKVGDAHRAKLYDLWNSEKVKELRKIHKQGEFYKNSVCKLCASNFV